MQVNQDKLMLATKEIAEACVRFAPENDDEACAIAGCLLTMAVTVASKIHGLEFSLPLIERLSHAAQEGLNGAIDREMERQRQ